MLAIARSEAEALELTVIELLKHRSGDHKVVLLCECPRRGKCVLKVLPRHLVRGQYRNHVATARLAREYDTGIFPDIFHIGAHLSVEEWIEGKRLKFLPEEEWDAVDFLGFLQRVHAFSRSAPRSENDLTAAEVRMLAESYLRRSFGFVNYQRPVEQLRSVRQLYSDRQAIARAVQYFEDITSGIRLPAYSILGDLTGGNVVYHRPSERLFIIDVEDITDGILSFDCAWLLTTIARRHCPLSLLIEAYHFISSPEFVTDAQEAQLMRVLLKMLLENDLRIIRTNLDKTRRLLEVVEKDIQATSLPHLVSP